MTPPDINVYITFPGVVGSIAICELCKKRTRVLGEGVKQELVRDENDDLNFDSGFISFMTSFLAKQSLVY